MTSPCKDGNMKFSLRRTNMDAEVQKSWAVRYLLLAPAALLSTLLQLVLCCGRLTYMGYTDEIP